MIFRVAQPFEKETGSPPAPAQAAFSSTVIPEWPAKTAWVHEEFKKTVIEEKSKEEKSLEAEIATLRPTGAVPASIL